MGSKPKVLVGSLDTNAPPLPPIYVDVMEQHFDVVNIRTFLDNPEKHQDIVGIFHRYGPNIDEKLLDKLPNLKVVTTISVGYSDLNVPMIRKRGIKIAHTRGASNEEVAEFGITMMLSAARNYIRFVGEYKEGYGSGLPIADVTPQFSGSTLGIVGMGRIGYTLAQQSKAFHVKILYHDIVQRSPEEEEAVGATYFSDLNEMLPRCDFVMVLLNLTPETRHIIGAEQFKLMKKSAIFVNCSRGLTVDQDALVEALKSHEIYCAALDVTTPEPLPKDHELFKLPNAILSPHIASQTTKTRKSMIELATENVLAAIEGRELPTEIPY